MKKNDIHRLEITDVTREGMGVGRADGMAVFVRSALVGDTVDARIIKVRGSFCVAIADRLITPSPHRIEPRCAVSGRCGGCAFQHMDYAAELALKRRWVEDALRRVGGLSVPVAPVTPSDTERYRNKAQFPIGRDARGRVVTGFYRRGTHDIVPIDDCLIGDARAGEALAAVREYAERRGVTTYDEASGTGLLRHVCLRSSMSGGLLLVLVANGEELPHADELVSLLRERLPGLAGVVLNVNRSDTNVVMGERCVTLWGRDAIEETLCGISFFIGPRSFFQVNSRQAERLYGHVRDLCALTGEQTLVDLYCGVGAMGLVCAGGARSVLGVERVPEAVEEARACAVRNGVANAQFMCGDAGECASELAAGGAGADVVLLDPPRKGCSADTLDAVLSMSPGRVVYVSCDPATLARDLRVLCAGGYRALSCQPFDMFPRTGHVESVVLLTK